MAAGSNPAQFGASEIGVGGAAGTYPICYWAWITVGANAGTMNMRWAQNTATVEDTTMLANSILRLRRLV
jgi:hypothetical protein